MASLNQCTFSGRVGKDPKTEYYDSGSVKARFSLALSPYKAGGETQWVNLEAWGKTAETVTNYVKKGSSIIVSCEFKEDSWTDKATGEQKSRPVFNVRQLCLMDKKGDRNSGGGESSGRSSQRSSSAPPAQPEEEEIPF